MGGSCSRTSSLEYASSDKTVLRFEPRVLLSEKRFPKSSKVIWGNMQFPRLIALRSIRRERDSLAGD